MEAVNTSFVTENVKRIFHQVSEQAVKCGRDPSGIRVMAVTKTVDPILVNQAIADGVRLLGENKAQELCGKYESYEKDNVEIHFIGHLQTNKVRQIIDKVTMVESVDSIRLAAELDRQAGLLNKTINALVEVNIGREENKSGVLPEQLPELLDEIGKLKRTQVQGLMTIPPICEKVHECERYFEQMFQLFIDIKQKKLDNINMDFLSMGMSSDFLQAIPYGANILRIGTAMFGRRDYSR